MKKEKIEIALLTYSDQVSVNFLNWVSKLDQTKREYNVVYHPGWRPVAYARNQAVDHFLKGDADRLLFIDDDIIPTENSNLIFENDQDIVSGIYYLLLIDQGTPSIQTAIYRKIYGGFESIDIRKHTADKITIDAAGTGSLLIKRRVFENEKMINNRKYLDAEGNETQLENDVAPYFRTINRPNMAEERSEDIDFVWRAKQLGFSCIADKQARFYHKKQVILDWFI